MKVYSNLLYLITDNIKINVQTCCKIKKNHLNIIKMELRNMIVTIKMNSNLIYKLFRLKKFNLNKMKAKNMNLKITVSNFNSKI